MKKWLFKGNTVEVFEDNEWWDAVVIAVKDNKVLIHFVDGARPIQ
jgi:hypothetical protein